MKKPGIKIDIPGFGKVQIDAILSDYTGTLAFSGKLVTGVRIGCSGWRSSWIFTLSLRIPSGRRKKN